MTRPASPHHHSWQSILALIIMATCARFLPHMPANFSPVGAMGLYAGAVLPWPWALCVSLAGLFLSDLVLGLYGPIAMLFVYAGLATNVLFGFKLCRSNNPTKIAASALLGATVFFLLSNFGVWLSGELYPRNLSGLVDCFVAAIPFFGNTLASQLLFSAILFGLHHVMNIYALRRESMSHK